MIDLFPEVQFVGMKLKIQRIFGLFKVDVKQLSFNSKYYQSLHIYRKTLFVLFFYFVYSLRNFILYFYVPNIFFKLYNIFTPSVGQMHLMFKNSYSFLMQKFCLWDMLLVVLKSSLLAFTRAFFQHFQGERNGHLF